MMTNSKKKTNSHIIENESISIIKDKLPHYWTIRDYKPDYGLDLIVEVFDKIDDKNETIIYQTLGEHFYIQVKGASGVVVKKTKIFKDKNVEKFKINPQDRELHKEIDVIKFQIETSELYTIERMSGSVPVFLFLVDVLDKNIYYICLNDYIDKVILPKNPNYTNKRSSVIYIPFDNIINNEGIQRLLLYSKRPKLYSFFIKAQYQANELEYISDEHLIKFYPLFIEKLLRFDIWSLADKWYFLNYYHRTLLFLRKNKFLPENLHDIQKLEMYNKEPEWTSQYSNLLFTMDDSISNTQIRILWKGLAGISNVYE